MDIESDQFKQKVSAAVKDENLKAAINKFTGSVRSRRAESIENFPEFDAVRDYSVAIKTHTLDHIEQYLEQFESNVIANGGHVHWCADDKSAKQVILDICRSRDVKTITKGKSMVTEEIDLNSFLDNHGILPLETDLGEYIIQLRKESPSHIIAPAAHLRQHQIADTFFAAHDHLDPGRPMDTAEALTEEARQELRERYVADAGITGANFMVAETGSTVIVTNEGNGDLVQSLSKTHIAVASIEKIIPTMDDVGSMLQLLARSAIGQDMNVYTTLSSGPRQAGDLDGPEHFHVVIIDNGRSQMLGGSEREMLRCIRCSACINHCPVYASIGGHAYGWVYSGPMGKVLTPSLVGLERAKDLPHASSLCGKCEEVCPMRIPLPKLMRNLREKQTEQRLTPFKHRVLLALWSFVVSNPRFYHFCTGALARILYSFGGTRGGFRFFPFMGSWTRHRDLMVPEKGSFFSLYKKMPSKRTQKMKGDGNDDI